MESFDGLMAVVTGGGTGMGAELVVQLAAQGCSVATCDVIGDTLADTGKRAANEAKAGARVTTHICDVADAVQVDRFRDEVLAEHDIDHINLLFNNAGIGGGGSFLTGSARSGTACSASTGEASTTAPARSSPCWSRAPTAT